MVCVCVFLFKQKKAYEVRISDWSSDVFSSDLSCGNALRPFGPAILQCWSYVPQFLPPSWTEEMTKSYAISAETQSYLGVTITQPNAPRFRRNESDRIPNRLSLLHASVDTACSPYAQPIHLCPPNRTPPDVTPPYHAKHRPRR